MKHHYLIFKFGSSTDDIPSDSIHVSDNLNNYYIDDTHLFKKQSNGVIFKYNLNYLKDHLIKSE